MAGALRGANLRDGKFPGVDSPTTNSGNGRPTQPPERPADTLGMSLLFLLAFRFDDRLLAELAWLLQLGDLRAEASA